MTSRCTSYLSHAGMCSCLGRDASGSPWPIKRPSPQPFRSDKQGRGPCIAVCLFVDALRGLNPMCMLSSHPDKIATVKSSSVNRVWRTRSNNSREHFRQPVRKTQSCVSSSGCSRRLTALSVAPCSKLFSLTTSTLQAKDAQAGQVPKSMPTPLI